jgi:hypothetical protein
MTSAKTDGLGLAVQRVSPMDDTYQFHDHLREHRPSRLGQRLWWVPAVAGVVVIIEGAVYLTATPSGQLSAVLAISPPLVAGLLFLVAWAALSIADWTYPSEKVYREAQRAATSQALAYIHAGRRAREQCAAAPVNTTELVLAPSGPITRWTAAVPQHPAPQTASR